MTREEQINQAAEKAADEVYTYTFQGWDDLVGLFKEGVKWADSHAWKPADGDDLPEIDREVVVLYQHYPLDVGEYSVGFAHRPPEYWDGKNIGTGVVTRYYPKKYGKGGWSSPDVKWWLDLDLPKPKVEE